MKNGEDRTVAIDEFVDIIFEIYEDEISLMIQNKSDHDITLNKEELKYRTPDGKIIYALPEKHRKNTTEFQKKNNRVVIQPSSAKRFVDHMNANKANSLFPGNNPSEYNSKIFTIIVSLKIGDNWQESEFNFKMMSKM